MVKYFKKPGMDKRILASLRICSSIIFVIGIMLFVGGMRLHSKMSLVVYKERGVFVSYFYLVTGSLLLVSSVGLALLKSWGRILTIISSLGIILFTLQRSWFFHSAILAHKQNYQVNLSKYFKSYYVSLVVIVLFSLLIYYLTRTKVKEQFR